MASDEPPAAVGQDGWAAGETRQPLLAAPGGESSDPAVIRSDGTEDCSFAGPRRVARGSGQQSRSTRREGRRGVGSIA